MTVYVVHPSRDDISTAQRFGDLRFVNRDYVYPDEVDDERIPITKLEPIRQAAREFDPDEDFLLIVGDHLQLIAFTAELVRHHAWFRVLRYDRQERAYYPVKIDVARDIGEHNGQATDAVRPDQVVV